MTHTFKAEPYGLNLAKIPTTIKTEEEKEKFIAMV